MTEKETITAVKRGDQEAFRPLVERYHQGLIRYVYGIVWDEAVADDIAQDSFITAYQKIQQFDEGYAFSTWLYRIARNQAFQYLKQARKLVPFDEEISETNDNVAELIDKDILAADVTTALAQIRPEYRSAIQLYYWEGKSYEEIADIMDTPLNTIRIWLMRAKQDLGRILI